MARPKHRPLLDLGETFNASVLFDDGQYLFTLSITFFKQADGRYGSGLYLTEYGTYDFYVAFMGAGIPTDGHLQIKAELPMYEEQQDLRSIAVSAVLLLASSWVFWLINEGGRRKK